MLLLQNQTALAQTGNWLFPSFKMLELSFNPFNTQILLTSSQPTWRSSQRSSRQPSSIRTSVTLSSTAAAKEPSVCVTWGVQLCATNTPNVRFLQILCLPSYQLTTGPYGKQIVMSLYMQTSFFSSCLICLVFEEPEDPSNRSFFSEIISSISDVKFSHNGRYMMTRDYLSVKIWDLNMENRPVETYQVSQVCHVSGISSALLSMSLEKEKNWGLKWL